MTILYFIQIQENFPMPLISKSSGMSLVEVIISIGILSVLMLSLTDYSLHALDVSTSNIYQIEKTRENRLSAERFSNQATKAEYIFPAGTSLSIYSHGFMGEINTDNAVALLMLKDPGDEYTSPTYVIDLFYLRENSKGKYDLYELTGAYDMTWEANTLPVSTFNYVHGNETKLLEDIILSESELTYILNQENGITDGVLKGLVNDVETNDPYALIKGFTWKLKVSKDNEYYLRVKGFSNNVPRHSLHTTYN